MKSPGTEASFPFDNDADDSSDEDYFAFVEWLSERTANELRQARGDSERQKKSLCRYYLEGERANLTPDELIDFLYVSSPSILDRADYNEEETDALVELSDSFAWEEFCSVVQQEDAQQTPDS